MNSNNYRCAKNIKNMCKKKLTLKYRNFWIMELQYKIGVFRTFLQKIKIFKNFKIFNFLQF